MSKSPLWSAPWTLEARVFATKAELSVEEEAAALGDDAWLLESSRVALDGVAASTTLRSLKERVARIRSCPPERQTWFASQRHGHWRRLRCVSALGPPNFATVGDLGIGPGSVVRVCLEAALDDGAFDSGPDGQRVLLVRLLVDDCSSSVVGAKYARASLGADLRAAVADMADVPEVELVTEDGEWISDDELVWPKYASKEVRAYRCHEAALRAGPYESVVVHRVCDAWDRDALAALAEAAWPTLPESCDLAIRLNHRLIEAQPVVRLDLAPGLLKELLLAYDDPVFFPRDGAESLHDEGCMGIAVLPPLRDRYPAKDAARVAPGRATVSCRVWAGADYEDLRLEVSVVDDSEPSRDVPEELAYDLDDAEDFPPIGAEKSLTPPRKMRRGDYPEGLYPESPDGDVDALVDAACGDDSAEQARANAAPEHFTRDQLDALGVAAPCCADLDGEASRSGDVVAFATTLRPRTTYRARLVTPGNVYGALGAWTFATGDGLGDAPGDPIDLSANLDLIHRRRARARRARALTRRRWEDVLRSTIRDVLDGPDMSDPPGGVLDSLRSSLDGIREDLRGMRARAAARAADALEAALAAATASRTRRPGAPTASRRTSPPRREQRATQLAGDVAAARGEAQRLRKEVAERRRFAEASKVAWDKVSKEWAEARDTWAKASEDIQAVTEDRDALLRKLGRFEEAALARASGGDLAALEEELDGMARARARARRARRAVPEDFVCPISCCVMVDPVIVSDGHTYERASIEQWLETHDTSPKTGLVLEMKHVVPNIALRNAIALFREANPTLED
ncbi:hypothetical protein SO694_00031161 [Aureococcus anophagefferens]|uniref:U-box domain-containing protein n=1 Tax=Aureococcus anophagefferens TaxID=44056 RepID=A0ABR1FJJ3_AURAN